LVEKSRHDCWILVLSGESLQRWFMERRIPCIISGSTYAGIKLPCVDQDYRATCRHATGRLIALGHRHLAFFNRRSRAAGDLESEAGFFEAVRASSYAKVEAQTVYHNDSRENIVQLIRQLFTTADPPTGLLVANSYCYLSVAGALARLGFNVPRDVSLISRDDDPFLAYADPEPTRYVITPGGLVRKFMFLLRPILEGGMVKPDPVRVVPRFIAGASCQAV
jgi:DNA-binding LacI/PurR family transcriptional regulator